MSRIKSAWEIALERSESIDIDETSLKKKESIKKGKIICGTYLNDVQIKPSTVINKLNKVNKEEFDDVRNGIIQTIYNNIKLPKDKFFKANLDHLNLLAQSLSTNKEDVNTCFSNLEKLYNSFIDSQEQLLTKLKEQYGSALQQQNPNVPLENNSEFIKIVEDNFNVLNEQASTMLNTFITELKTVLA